MKTYSGRRKMLAAFVTEMLEQVSSQSANESGPCWEWPFTRSPMGYGVGPRQAWTGSRIVSRQVWTYLHGPVSAETCVLHRCDNPPCYRPSHLFVGSRTDNSNDKVAKGRSSRTVNEASGKAKLTDAQVAEIRARRDAGESCTTIAAAYGVHPAHVSRITRGLRRPAEHPEESYERGWSLRRIGAVS